MILFHGTSRSVMDSLSDENPLKTPYLTDNPELAEYYAECAMEELEDDDWVILAVNLTDDELTYLKADFHAFEEPISITRNDHASSDREWFKMLENGEIRWPESNDDYATSLEFTGSAWIDMDIPTSRLVETSSYQEAIAAFESTMDALATPNQHSASSELGQ